MHKKKLIPMALDHGVDCNVMGSHKPGFGDDLPGTKAVRFVRHAARAVHVHRR